MIVHMSGGGHYPGLCAADLVGGCFRVAGVVVGSTASGHMVLGWRPQASKARWLARIQWAEAVPSWSIVMGLCCLVIFSWVILCPSWATMWFPPRSGSRTVLLVRSTT